MTIVPTGWSDRHKQLNQLIRKEARFDEAVELALDLHRDLHTAKVGQWTAGSAIDALLGDLKQNEYAVMPTAKDETIAWALWHIARIEDLTMNLLVGGGAQVFDGAWKERMHVSVTDTGNAMTDDEIMAFSKEVCAEELLNYRDAVGIQSREIVRALRPGDMTRKVTADGIARILREGGVTQQADSIWLLDFWGKKDVAGLLLMPLTRHQTLHLNDCDQWKQRIRAGKKAYAE